jgi:hypothetical protein
MCIRIHQLIRAEAFDETVMESHIDEESNHYLATLFATTTVATAHPILGFDDDYRSVRGAQLFASRT